jgi:hypothetical protein
MATVISLREVLFIDRYLAITRDGRCEDFSAAHIPDSHSLSQESIRLRNGSGSEHEAPSRVTQRDFLAARDRRDGLENTFTHQLTGANKASYALTGKFIRVPYRFAIATHNVPLD